MPGGKRRVFAHALFTVALALGWTTTPARSDPGQEGWHYMHYKTAVNLVLDQNMVAVYNPEELPDEAVEGYLKAVGFDAFVMEAAGRPWYHLVREPSPGDPGPDIAGLITQATARPDNPFFITPVFHPEGDPKTLIYPSSGTSVGFEEDLPPANAEAELRRAGIVGEILERNWLRTPNIYRIARGLKSGIQLLRHANALAAQPTVRFASPGFRVVGDLASGCATAPAGLPNDAYYASHSWGPQIVDADPSRDICIGDPQVIVAVLDDGTGFHPELWTYQSAAPPVSGNRGAFLVGAQCTTDCYQTECNSTACGAGQGVCVSNTAMGCTGLPATNCDRHGTEVTSVISAALNNGIGTAGIAPAVSIMPVKIGRYIKNEPLGGTCYQVGGGVADSMEVAAGIDWAAAHGARVTTLSWQTGTNFAEVTEAYKRTYANDGVVHFVSAGNSNRDFPEPPGGSNNALIEIGPVNSVSGQDQSGALFYGNTTFASSRGPGLDFTGPASGIFLVDRTNDPTDLIDTIGYCSSSTTATYCFGNVLDSRGGLYVESTGTSFSAPLVAAIAALIISKRPGISAPQVEMILRKYSDDQGPPGYDTEFGWGRPNVERILIALENGYLFADDFESGDFRTWTSVVGGVQ